jgi:hypothetical protein
MHSPLRLTTGGHQGTAKLYIIQYRRKPQAESFLSKDGKNAPPPLIGRYCILSHLFARREELHTRHTKNYDEALASSLSKIR